GYKPGLGIERYLRDGKAGWVMGPTNEVLRQFVGKAALLGFQSLDYWNQSLNERVLNNELKKLDNPGKKALAERLLKEATAKAAEQTASCCLGGSARFLSPGDPFSGYTRPFSLEFCRGFAAAAKLLRRRCELAEPARLSTDRPPPALQAGSRSCGREN